MASSNILETPRLLIRGTTEDEYVQIFQQYDDDALMQYFGFLNETELETEKAKVKGGLSNYRTEVMFFHLIEKASNKVLGSCGYHHWFKIHSRAEIGYALKKDEYKNKGFMREAIVPIIDYGFNKMALNRIEAFIGPNNIASQKTVLGQGFKQEGILKEHYNAEGKLQDSIVFALLKSEYKF